MSTPPSSSDGHRGNAGYHTRTECPLCGSAHYRESLRRDEELICTCTSCHFSFRADPLHPLASKERSAAELEAIDLAKLPIFESLLSKLGTPKAGALLVDIGASSGYFVEVAGSAGWNAVGIEYGQGLAVEGREAGRSIIVGNGELLPVRTGIASALTYWDVLDQFDNPRAALAEAARVLDAGGTLAIRVRHGGVHQFMRRRRWLPKKLSVMQNNLYSPKSLRKALADAGFHDVRVGVAHTSSGDPYGSMKGTGAIGLSVAKTVWDIAARVIAFVSAGNLVISPSIDAIATRASGGPEHR